MRQGPSLPRAGVPQVSFSTSSLSLSLLLLGFDEARDPEKKRHSEATDENVPHFLCTIRQ